MVEAVQLLPLFVVLLAVAVYFFVQMVREGDRANDAKTCADLWERAFHAAKQSHRERTEAAERALFPDRFDAEDD